MAEYKKYINALRKCAKEHEYEIVSFAHIRTADLCNDTADLLEKLETRDTITIPKDATNGDMVKAIFGITDNDIDEGLSTTYVYTKTRVLKGGSQDYLREQITFNRDWWNAPYKKEVEE